MLYHLYVNIQMFIFVYIYILLLGYVNKLDCLQCTGYVKALLIMHKLFMYLIYIDIHILVPMYMRKYHYRSSRFCLLEVASSGFVMDLTFYTEF